MDVEELCRVVSPPGTRPTAAGKPVNDINAATASYAESGKGKMPIRSRREGENLYGSDDGANSAVENTCE
jgi:hypothetical protein